MSFKMSPVISDYLALTKPRLTLLALATALLGYWLGSMEEMNLTRLVHLLVGSALIGSSANTLNQWIERDIDKRMERTKHRPLPSGRLSIRHALIFGIVSGLLGTIYLALFTSLLCAMLGALTVLSYIFIYTPLKRKTELNTFAGAVTGALPILMGWTAAGSEIGAEAWALFWILFVWQLPHFLAIAWVYKKDYLDSGLRMISLHDKQGLATAWQIVFFTVILVIVSLVPIRLGMAGVWYLIGALTGGVFFIVFAVNLVRSRMKKAKSFVSVSIIYLSWMIVFMIVDKV